MTPPGLGAQPPCAQVLSLCPACPACKVHSSGFFFSSLCPAPVPTQAWHSCSGWSPLSSQTLYWLEREELGAAAWGGGEREEVKQSLGHGPWQVRRGQETHSCRWQILGSTPSRSQIQMKKWKSHSTCSDCSFIYCQSHDYDSAGTDTSQPKWLRPRAASTHTEGEP